MSDIFWVTGLIAWMAVALYGAYLALTALGLVTAALLHFDGMGASAAAGKNKKGIGLLNMRERIERHGDEFDFQSEPGMTRVTAFIAHKYL